MERPYLQIKLATLIVTLAFGGLLAGCGSSYPTCDTDSECHEGEFCVNGQCQQCRETTDCGDGQSCNGGRCDAIDGYCSSDAECADGETCESNGCVAAMSTAETLPSGDENGGGGGEFASSGDCELESAYFGFDASELDSRTRDAMQANVRCMRERDLDRLHVTGHTDDRGTEAYNMALGDRRARGVKRYLTSLGLSANEISMSSAGEEWACGTDEASWARDRRVDVTER